MPGLERLEVQAGTGWWGMGIHDRVPFGSLYLVKAVGSSRRSHVVALEFVGQRGTRILELVMDGFPRPECRAAFGGSVRYLRFSVLDSPDFEIGIVLLSSEVGARKPVVLVTAEVANSASRAHRPNSSFGIDYRLACSCFLP